MSTGSFHRQLYGEWTDRYESETFSSTTRRNISEEFAPLGIRQWIHDEDDPLSQTPSTVSSEYYQEILNAMRGDNEHDWQSDCNLEWYVGVDGQYHQRIISSRKSRTDKRVEWLLKAIKKEK